jgi:hypothetical protein
MENLTIIGVMAEDGTIHEHQKMNSDTAIFLMEVARDYFFRASAASQNVEYAEGNGSSLSVICTHAATARDFGLRAYKACNCAYGSFLYFMQLSESMDEEQNAIQWRGICEDNGLALLMDATKDIVLRAEYVLLTNGVKI